MSYLPWFLCDGTRVHFVIGVKPSKNNSISKNDSLLISLMAQCDDILIPYNRTQYIILLYVNLSLFSSKSKDPLGHWMSNFFTSRTSKLTDAWNYYKISGFSFFVHFENHIQCILYGQGINSYFSLT